MQGQINNFVSMWVGYGYGEEYSRQQMSAIHQQMVNLTAKADNCYLPTVTHNSARQIENVFCRDKLNV